jgi:hypothetical protein
MNAAGQRTGRTGGGHCTCAMSVTNAVQGPEGSRAGWPLPQGGAG